MATDVAHCEASAVNHRGGEPADDALEAAVLRATDLVAGAISVTVLTGAGISTDSGIPDFRGPEGVWTKNPEAEKASDIRVFVSDPDVRRARWDVLAHGGMWDGVEPNDGHQALVPLEAGGRLHTLVTQNVDGLHALAGSNPARIVEIHGTVREAMCLGCDWRAPIDVVLDRVRSGDVDPHCDRCGDLLKSATVSFGQALFPGDMERAEEAARACDLLLAVGSTLGVYPVAAMVPVAVRHGAALVVVNGSPTEMDHLADVVVRGSISEVLPRIVGGRTGDSGSVVVES